MRMKKEIERLEKAAKSYTLPLTYHREFSRLKDLLYSVLKENLPSEFERLVYYGEDENPAERHFCIECKFFSEVMPKVHTEFRVRFNLDLSKPLVSQMEMLSRKIQALSQAYGDISSVWSRRDPELVSKWFEARTRLFKEGFEKFHNE